MLNVGVFFGSRAAEHDVSIISGLQILENADKAKYNAFPVYVSRKGEWFVGEPLKKIETYKPFDENMKGLTKVYLPPVPNMGGLYAMGGSGIFAKAKLLCPMDCAILAFHGMNGEDGTIQGLMELADMPYSSCGVLGSAVGMDRIVMKAVFKSMGLNVLEGTYCYRDKWLAEKESIIAEAEKIGYPVYVKPANLGSSIGISKACDRAGFIKAMDTAAAYDKRILIEKGLENPREINCACLGMGANCEASLCEEPVSWEEFLTFDSKYISNAGKGMESLSRKIPAPISDELTERIRSTTKRIFSILDCKGVVRIDYMIDGATGMDYVCEINTIPGSFAFYLFEPMGISFKQLVDRLIEFAIAGAKDKAASTFAYDSKILDKALNGTKTVKK